jgi:hypothetical protein
MNGTTSQLLSLITHGNHFFKKDQLSLDYYPDNATFKYCNKADFLYSLTNPDGTIGRRVVAADPVSWFKLFDNRAFIFKGALDDLDFEKPEDNQQYEDLSFNLYNAINQAFLSSVNSVKTTN